MEVKTDLILAAKTLDKIKIKYLVINNIFDYNKDIVTSPKLGVKFIKNDLTKL